MAFTNKLSTVMFLVVAITITWRLVDGQTSPTFPTMTPICAQVIPDLLEKCFATVRDTPTDECCTDLKAATATQVTCLCDNYIANPAFVEVTGPYAAGITTKCGVFDKFSCKGTTKEKEKTEYGSASSTNIGNGSDKTKTEGSGGRSNNVAPSMAVFGLVASLIFVMF